MPLQHLDKKTFNPFITSTPKPGVVEWLKILLVFPTLGIVRVLLIVILLLITAIVCSLFTMAAPRSGPLPAWRATPIMAVVVVNARLILFVLGFYYIPVVGRKASSRVSVAVSHLTSQEAPIIVSNHISYIEPLFFSGQGCSHVAKSAIGEFPLLSAIARGLQLCFVDRTASASCAETKDRIAERFGVGVRSRVQGAACGRVPVARHLSRRSAWLRAAHASGTTSNGRTLLQFKYGAFAPGAPVQRWCSPSPLTLTAAVVRVTFNFFDPTSCYGSQYWWIRLLSQFVQVRRDGPADAQFMEVTYLPVHYPTDAERASASLYANNVRAAMAKALNVEPSEHALGDLLLQREAAKVSRMIYQNVCVIGYAAIARASHHVTAAPAVGGWRGRVWEAEPCSRVCRLVLLAYCVSLCMWWVCEVCYCVWWVFGVSSEPLHGGAVWRCTLLWLC